jgi:hypothetical protein
MITVLLAIDGIAFFAILAFISVWLIILSAVDEPSPGGSGIILTITLVLVALFTNAGQTILKHPAEVAIGVVGYFIVGCFYSVFIRWPLYLNGLRMQLNAAKKGILEQYKITTIITSEKDPFRAWSNAVYNIGNLSGLCIDDDGKITPPQYRNNKARLSTWAILWPWNVVWVLVRKPIVWIFEELLNLQILKHICQAISDRMFKDFNN